MVFAQRDLTQIDRPVALQVLGADDEPVSGLDPKVTAEMYALIQKLNYEDGITVVMISHDLNAALQYASHILHIGDTVFFGTKAAYLNEFPQVWQKGGEAQ